MTDYRVIKENDLFLLTAADGDMMPDSMHGHGLYTKDTRFLSEMSLAINGEKPILLSSEADQNYLSRIVLTNPHQEKDGELILWRESIELIRTRFICDDVLYETVKATNYNPHKARFQLSVTFAADYHDMFIVRGFQQGTTGEQLPTEYTALGTKFHYMGADRIKRSTWIQWSEPSRSNANGTAVFELELEPGAAQEIDFQIVPVFNDESAQLTTKENALTKLQQSYDKWEVECMDVSSDHSVFNEMYKRSLLDLRALSTDFGFGTFPVAGLPWYAVPFGRDSLITALQMLPVQASLARGTLYTMAHFQGTKLDPTRDEQPGKIMHELRQGELANTGQIPFAPYYGTIDATPLFLILLSEYVQRTEDSRTFLDMLPHVERALEWIDVYGDRDNDSFVEYYQEASKGIANQGWKDSGNSVVHSSGQYAEAPIALAEVQGYVYQGKIGIAKLLRKFAGLASGDWTAWAERLEQQATELRQRFEERFWMEEEQFYAIALDREKQQVACVTSNPGHLLMTGMLDPARASAVARRLLAADMFSGYGIRTMAEGEMGYNPMSYHNGSIWPHDNSMCLMGLSKLGYAQQTVELLQGMLKTAACFEYSRLPELFCGYDESFGKPVRYPVACSPQSWAAGTALVMADAMIGLRRDDESRTLQVNPVLPEGMNELKVRRLQLGSGYIDLDIHREGRDCRVTVLSNTSGWTIGEQLQVAHNI